MRTYDTDNYTNDITINPSTHDIQMAVDKVACGVIIKNAIQTIYGEIQLNTNLGVPYFETVFSNPNLIYKWRSSVINTVKAFEFVNEIISFTHEFSGENKCLSYKLSILTTFGSLEIKDMIQ